MSNWLSKNFPFQHSEKIWFKSRLRHQINSFPPWLSLLQQSVTQERNVWPPNQPPQWHKINYWSDDWSASSCLSLEVNLSSSSLLGLNLSFPYSLSVSGSIHSVCISVLFLSPFLSRPVSLCPSPPLTLLLITKHTGAISTDLKPTHAPLSIHPRPTVLSLHLCPRSLSVAGQKLLCAAPVRRTKAAGCSGAQKGHSDVRPLALPQGQDCLNGDALNAHWAKSIKAFWGKCMLPRFGLKGNVARCEN